MARLSRIDGWAAAAAAAAWVLRLALVEALALIPLEGG